ncbi:aspartate ammonia-lyase [Streptomyces phaeochromogenes]|uniref:aspartate ammonia-lyase n=1 Tax=Streptomyces phaeochromogenes TaxID=1923 RepID=UPI0006E36CC6|nr:aspartate ammonia-lyase [Streptomyces phaeochromogenes]
MTVRSEHDLLGDRDVPAEAYWGVHSLRAKENFPITGMPISAYPHLIEALAAVKEAAARANEDLGLLEPRKAAAIVAACREIRDGKLHDQFVVDVIQGGAGTSTNMNANEVVANRALELLGHAKGEYEFLHPNEDVNLGQSTNDVYPTAVKVATVFAVRELLKAMAVLQDAFAAKALEFRDVLKMGRTQLQDAVPMTLGQEFSAYAVMLDEDRLRLAEAVELIHEINLGATAIGTGLNAPAGYAEAARRHLADITGLPLVTAANLVEATQDCGAFVQMSGVLKRIAVKLSKSCNDLRLLSSGPRAGLNEINLPPVQAGSTIMPGKVNPVIPEAVLMVAAQVTGNDATIATAGASGNFELNVMLPVIARNVLESVRLLANVSRLLADRTVDGITANRERAREYAESSPSVVTPLNKYIGYEEAAKVAKKALAERKTIREVVLESGYVERGDLTREQLDEALDVLRMTRP